MTGDLLEAEVLANGWQLALTFEGLVPGGVYDLGLGANNSLGSQKVTLGLTRKGYTDACVLDTISAIVYGTKQVRKPDPDDATIDEDANGGNVILKLALSEPIFGDDTSITLNLLAGLYDDASNGSNAASGFGVTNNSTETYEEVKCIANWSCVPRKLVQADTLKLRACAFSYFGQERRPVRAVKFTVTDESANSETVIVTAPTIDPVEYGDECAVQEYIATIDTTGFTDGDKLLCDFVAYPWVGDASAIVDTSAEPAPQPTPRPKTIEYLLDRAGTYEGRVAVVDSVAGDNGTGATVDRGSFDAGSPPNAYATIEAALIALKAAMTRGDLGNCVVYLRDNAAHSFINNNAGVKADTRVVYAEIATFPTDTQAEINAGGGFDSFGDGRPHKFSNIKMSLATNSLNLMDWLWLDGCEWNESSFASLRASDLVFATNCTFTQIQSGSGGFGGYSSDVTAVALVRGAKIQSTVVRGFHRPYVFVGNRCVEPQSSGTFEISAGTTLHQDNLASLNHCWIRAFNDLKVVDGGVVFEFTTKRDVSVQGQALVGNILERQIATGSAASVQSSGVLTTGQECTNILIWHNTFADWKHNIWYNDTAGVAATYAYISYKGNIAADYNIKSDTFANDGTNINNWHPLFGVSMMGNLLAERPNGGAPQLFLPSYAGGFNGLESYVGASAPIDPDYVDDASIDGDATGNGDYRAKSASAKRTVTLGLLPYDLVGNPRPNDGTEFFGALLPVPDPPTTLTQS